MYNYYIICYSYFNLIIISTCLCDIVGGFPDRSRCCRLTATSVDASQTAMSSPTSQICVSCFSVRQLSSCGTRTPIRRDEVHTLLHDLRMPDPPKVASMSLDLPAAFMARPDALVFPEAKDKSGMAFVRDDVTAARIAAVATLPSTSTMKNQSVVLTATVIQNTCLECLRTVSRTTDWRTRTRVCRNQDEG